MTTNPGTASDPHPLFVADEHDTLLGRVSSEIFSALTEVVSGQGEWSAQSAARVRAEGRTWAEQDRPVDELLTVVRTMTRGLINRCTVGSHEQDPLAYEFMVLRLGDAGRRVSRELSFGFFDHAGDHARTSPAPAGQTPAGHTPAPDAGSSAVLAVRAPSRTSTDIDRVFGGHPRAVVRTTSEGARVLLPAARREHAVVVAGQVLRRLPGDVWIAMHWQKSPSARTHDRTVPAQDGEPVTHDIHTALLALGSPPGLYEAGDVLDAYGTAQVAERPARAVEPLRPHPVLRDTLTALIATDGVRPRACEHLGIHRNTLDRRLQRIAQLTGHRPDGPHGLDTLRAALAADAVLRLRRHAERTAQQPHPTAPRRPLSPASGTVPPARPTR